MNIYAPQRIWATVNGISTRLPSQCKQFIGGWSQDPTRPGATEYVRADMPNPLSAENARLREALKKIARSLEAEISSHRCSCPSPCEDYHVHPGPCGTREAESYRNILAIALKAILL